MIHIDYKRLNLMAWVGGGANLLVAIGHFIGGTISTYIMGVFHLALAAWVFFFVRRQVRKSIARRAALKLTGALPDGPDTGRA